MFTDLCPPQFNLSTPLLFLHILFFAFWLYGVLIFWSLKHCWCCCSGLLQYFLLFFCSGVISQNHTRSHSCWGWKGHLKRWSPCCVLLNSYSTCWSTSGASSHLSLTLSWSSVGSCHGATHGVLLSLFPSWYWSWSWLLVSFQTTELGQPFLKWTGVMWVVVTQGTHIQ